MKSFIKRITWLRGMETGWGNGYVIIPEGHPMHGKNYDDIDVDVHGGLTFGESAKSCNWEEISDEDKAGWVVGFDTAHYMDNLTTCPESFVLEETERLKQQLLEMA